MRGLLQVVEEGGPEGGEERGVRAVPEEERELHGHRARALDRCCCCCCRRPYAACGKRSGRERLAREGMMRKPGGSSGEDERELYIYSNYGQSFIVFLISFLRPFKAGTSGQVCMHMARPGTQVGYNKISILWITFQRESLCLAGVQNHLRLRSLKPTCMHYKLETPSTGTLYISAPLAEHYATYIL